jgi:hypothetical protein
MVVYIKIEILNPLTYNYTYVGYNNSSLEKMTNLLSNIKEIPYNDTSLSINGAPQIEEDIFLCNFNLCYPQWAGTKYGIIIFLNECFNFNEFKCIMKNGVSTISGNLYFKKSLKDEAYKEMINNVEYLFIESFNPQLYLDGKFDNRICFNKIGDDYKKYFDLVHKTWSKEKKIGPERKIKVTLAKKVKDLN